MALPERSVIELEEKYSLLEARLVHAEQRAADLQAQNAQYLETIKQLEALHAEEREMAHRLARVNANASESIAQLEDRDERQLSINDSLARANAHGAELVCELEEQAARLREALERVRVLQGIISICMHCHKIREDGEVWNRLEEYMSKHSDVRFSHGLCPHCLEEHYGEE